MIGFRQYYNITSSDENRFVWFRVAKVGTRTILDILKKNSKVSIHGSNVIYDKRKFKNYFKFAFVRNPWDRVVSCYQNKIVEKMKPDYFGECLGKSFEYFVKFIQKENLSKSNRHIRLQSRLFPCNDVDFIGRFENFNSDVKFVLNKIGMGVKDIAKLNTSGRKKNYRDYYNENTREIIRKKYAKDIKIFKYSF